jgi:cytidyltransferase-like protein
MYLLITGGFDPIHSGHIRAFHDAAKLGKLVIGLNSDSWLIRKKGAYLLPYSERVAVARNLQMVHSVLTAWDDSDDSACTAIYNFYHQYKDKKEPLAFINGGDRVPAGADKNEFELCSNLDIVSIFGVGGHKTASSSNFLAAYIERMAKK